METKPTYEELERKVKELERVADEYMRKEKAFQVPNQEKEAILNSLLEHVVHQDTEMKILWANRAACESVNLTHEELLGRHCYEIWPQRSDPCPDCPVKKAIETCQPQEIEKTTPDGRCWFIRGYPLIDSNGNIVGGIEVTLEVTERKQVEKTLRESEERYRSLIHKIQAAVVVHDADTRIIACNSKAQELLGLTEDQMLGKTAIDPDWKFFNAYGERMSLKEYPVNQVLATRQPLRDLTAGIYSPKKVEQVWVLVNADPVLDYKGNIQQVIVTFMDITEPKRTEKALRVSEEKYRSLFENTGTATFVTEEDMTVSQVNAKCEELSGYSRDEIVGKMKTTDFIPAEELERIKKYHIGRRTKDDDIPPEYELKLADKNGNIKNVIIQVGMIPGTKQSIASIIDISPLKQTEKALLFKDNIISSSSSIIATCDLDRNMTYGNPSFLKTWGFDDPKEFLGRPFWEFWLVEDQLEEIMRLLRVEGTWAGEIQAKRKDGTIFDVQVSAATVFDSEGIPFALTSTSIDITERKRIEKEREKLIKELQEALKEIKMLRGILPLCYFCKKIRDDKGYWERVDVYIDKYSQADISHSVCPDCAKEHYPDLDINE